MNGRTNGQKTGSLYRVMPEAGVTKMKTAEFANTADPDKAANGVLALNAPKSIGQNLHLQNFNKCFVQALSY